MTTPTYDQDFYSWSQRQAQLLRERRFADIDLEHLIEEIEDMGKSEKRALQSYLEVLLMHLLKWHYQPAFQGRSWACTIVEQRQRIEEHLADNPGLKGILPELIRRAYGYAITGAVRETGLPAAHFPASCPWTFAKFMDTDFWP